MRKIFIVTATLMMFFVSQAISQFSVNIGSATDVESGTNATIDITANGFTNISGLQFSMNYDSLILEFVEARNFATAIGINAQAISGPNGVGVKKGQITFSWFSNASNGETIPNGTRLFSIVFKTIGAKCTSSAVRSSNVPRVREVTKIVNNEPTEVPYAGTDGNISIKCTGGGNALPCPDPVCTNTANLQIIGGKVNSQTGSEVCVPFTVQNFRMMQSGQGAFTWNPAELQYVNRVLPASGALTPTDFTFNDLNVATGRLGVIWGNSSPSNPVTLPDNTKIIDLCFKVLAASPDTVCVLFGQGSSIPALEWTNNSGEVGVCLKNGNVILGGAPPADAVEIKVNNATGAQGDIVCVDVTVNNFDNILGLGIEFNYNASQLEFVRTDMYNLEALGPEDFNNSAGKVKLAWTSPSAITKADGTKIFQLCFRILGPCPGSSQITFGPTEVTALVNNQAVAVPNQTTPGTISCSDGPVDPPMITCTQGSITNVSCNGLSTGGVNLTVTGTKLNECVIEWKLAPNTIIRAAAPVASGTNLSGVPAGQYIYEVRWTVDNRVLCTGNVTITQPAAINIPTAGVVTNAGCNQKGSINLSLISGGTSPYTYSWTPNLGNTNNPQNLDPGSYTVTVTDASGCTATVPAFTIIQAIDPLSVTVSSVNVKCNGGQDGSISFAPSGGCAPYTVSPAVLTGLKAGSYTVIVTDNKGTTASATTTITEPAALVIGSPVVTNANQGLNNGSITITISGGTPLYAVAWSGGLVGGSSSGTFNTNNVGAGIYTATITDANGCTTTLSNIEVKTITDAGVAPTIQSVTGTNISCFGESTGTVTVAFNGTLPIRAKINNGPEQTINTAGAFTFTNLPVGTYTVTLTNLLGNATSQSVTLTQPSRLLTTTTVECTEINGATGSSTINVTPNSGTAPYTYLWSTSSTASKIENLARGVYNVTVTDSNGCTLSITNIEVKNCTNSGGENCYTANKIITPNGDNFNDQFVITCVSDNSNNLVIFDRWGKTVFSQLDYDNTWAGTDRGGKDLDEGVYMWVLTNRLGQGQNETYKGTISILRTK